MGAFLGVLFFGFFDLIVGEEAESEEDGGHCFFPLVFGSGGRVVAVCVCLVGF